MLRILKLTLFVNLTWFWRNEEFFQYCLKYSAFINVLIFILICVRCLFSVKLKNVFLSLNETNAHAGWVRKAIQRNHWDLVILTGAIFWSTTERCQDMSLFWLPLFYCPFNLVFYHWAASNSDKELLRSSLAVVLDCQRLVCLWRGSLAVLLSCGAMQICCQEGN